MTRGGFKLKKYNHPEIIVDELCDINEGVFLLMGSWTSSDCYDPGIPSLTNMYKVVDATRGLGLQMNIQYNAIHNSGTPGHYNHNQYVIFSIDNGFPSGMTYATLNNVRAFPNDAGTAIRAITAYHQERNQDNMGGGNFTITLYGGFTESQIDSMVAAYSQNKTVPAFLLGGMGMDVYDVPWRTDTNPTEPMVTPIPG